MLFYLHEEAVENSAVVTVVVEAVDQTLIPDCLRLWRVRATTTISIIRIAVLKSQNSRSNSHISRFEQSE